MLATIGHSSMDSFMSAVLPQDLASRTIRDRDEASYALLPAPLSELELRNLLASAEYFGPGTPKKCLVGQGYYGTHCPAVIRRGLLENAAWYTSYTPYQPEISQGRLEGLLTFQTMVSELTGLPISNASLLDEATAACEAMTMLFNSQMTSQQKVIFLVDAYVFPQTMACLRTRAEPLGIVVKPWRSLEDVEDSEAFGILFQYPDGLGRIRNVRKIIDATKARGIRSVCATDLLALTLLASPGELGADVAIGSAQRFGVPMGFGGPHAAFFSCGSEFIRRLPGRIVGVSRDQSGRRALRLALQTREQHIRRERATSNICTAQALLANVSAMYAVYHGPTGLRRIAERVHHQATCLANAARQLGHDLVNHVLFDTIVFRPRSGVQVQEMLACASQYGMELGRLEQDGEGELISLSVDETVTSEDVANILGIMALEPKGALQREVIREVARLDHDKAYADIGVPEGLRRDAGSFMKQRVFNKYHSEMELGRYMHELASRDLSLLNSMIPLGSCTMKLNPAAAMDTLTLGAVTSLHPFASNRDSGGYQRMIQELSDYLCKITGFTAVSFQPNSGAQGELTGLLMIRKYHCDRDPGRDRSICLIPRSSHGTNPASAALAGYTVIPVDCTADGRIDNCSLDKQLDVHGERIACLMVTYPSTFGVFGAEMASVIDRIHGVGGLVYLDGANMNAQMGLLRPADIGADLCHLNLHKTFCIPHGGGGPGAGPVCVSSPLAPYLPRHPHDHAGRGGEEKDSRSIGSVSGAPHGSASILAISWAYIKLVGGDGLRECSEMALLNANYMMKRLEEDYRVMFRNDMHQCAHEFVLDCRPFKGSAGVDVIDIAKRLQVCRQTGPSVVDSLSRTILSIVQR